MAGRGAPHPGRLRGSRVILVDADVLGRNRTGDETYVLNLLRRLPVVAPDLTFAAVTRHPELVPEGVEAIELPARTQELRMAWSLPRLLQAAAAGAHPLPARAPARLARPQCRDAARSALPPRCVGDGARRPSHLQSRRAARRAAGRSRPRGLRADEARRAVAVRIAGVEGDGDAARRRPRFRARR